MSTVADSGSSQNFSIRHDYSSRVFRAGAASEALHNYLSLKCWDMYHRRNHGNQLVNLHHVDYCCSRMMEYFARAGSSTSKNFLIKRSAMGRGGRSSSRSSGVVSAEEPPSRYQGSLALGVPPRH